LLSIINRLLTALILAAAVAGLTACLSGPPKTAAEREADKELSDQVQTALTSDKTLYARHIKVRADSGVVTLSGYVWTTDELAAAPQIAQSVAGVSKVVNRIEVDRGAIQDSGVTR
jgi:hyperosmotically inducible periplasmic protein